MKETALGGFLSVWEETIMISCTLGDKKYTVDFISGRALREMEPASNMYAKVIRLANDVTNGKEVSDEAGT